MDWDDLRYFLAVGSREAAACKFQTGQATISRRVRTLEAAQGIVLFERLNTG
ncbi:LysR family transcriptional regulator [Microvirga rosea]|uniref:LysR family transcriptional regulator n=1 Tax=Microvirga rosea TaxID=2715425 RepID=UPI001D0AB051|nr:LysR family transcriptional regulator [Microvirga rosea]